MLRYYVAFFHTLKIIISKNNSKGNPKINAYYLISLFQGINFLSIYNILKSFIDSLNNIEMTFIFYVFTFFVPPLILNYIVFLKKSGKEIIFDEEFVFKDVNIKKLLFFTGIYFAFSIIFYGVSILVNI